jgi:hypothetical protein
VPVRLDYATVLGVIGGDTVVLKSNRFIACNDASETYRMSPFGKPEIKIIWSVRFWHLADMGNLPNARFAPRVLIGVASRRRSAS